MQTQFHVPKGIYLLSHSVGCLPKRSEAALAQSYLAPWQASGGDAWPAWLNEIDNFCQQLGTLLNAQAEDFCPQSNLSSGLTKFLCALPRHPVKNTILMHASAFPSMGFVVDALKDLGYQLKLIDESHPANDPQAWQQALSEDVALAFITHVHSNTGVLTPVKQVVEVCRKQDVLTAVDIAQSVGTVPIDIHDWNPDLVLGSCVKWLCGGPGAGFLWLNPNLSVPLKPMDVGWFSHENPFEFDIRHFKPAKGAKQFWGGTPTVAPFVTAAASIKMLGEVGVDTVRKHSLSLLSTVLDSARPCLKQAPDLDATGGTLCLSLDPDLFSKIDEGLTALQCRYDKRGNTFRLSFHIYNTMEEAENVAAVFAGR